MDSKPTNPKDAIGCKKLPTHVIPDPALVYLAHAMYEGAVKYGQFNYRAVGVRASIYLDAIDRHLMKYTAGEWEDPLTKVPHLGSIMACAAIIIDAHVCGKLTDDRPPPVPGLPKLIDEMEGKLAHLREIFKDHNPHQYTIGDTNAVQPVADEVRDRG